MGKFKKIYMYDMEGKLIETFNTTGECAEYIGCEPMYIYHNLKYCKRIRCDNRWYTISRELKKVVGKQQDY